MLARLVVAVPAALNTCGVMPHAVREAVVPGVPLVAPRSGAGLGRCPGAWDALSHPYVNKKGGLCES